MSTRPDLTERIARAKELLRTVRHVNIATVNADGSPHGSPVFAAFGSGLEVYWASHTEAQHSHNIARDGRAFITVFNSVDVGGGLYIEAVVRPLEGDDLTAGLANFNVARRRHDRPAIPRNYFEATAAQRLYCATPVRVWVNMADKDAAGFIIRDQRYDITAADVRD